MYAALQVDPTAYPYVYFPICAMNNTCTERSHSPGCSDGQ